MHVSPDLRVRAVGNRNVAYIDIVDRLGSIGTYRTVYRQRIRKLSISERGDGEHQKRCHTDEYLVLHSRHGTPPFAKVF